MSRPLRLKHCPFCGGEAKIKETARGDEFYVQCQLCGTTTRDTMTIAEALRLWAARKASPCDVCKYAPPTAVGPCRGCPAQKEGT